MLECLCDHMITVDDYHVSIIERTAKTGLRKVSYEPPEAWFERSLIHKESGIMGIRTTAWLDL